jgi:DNA (cytosine-5)-methyltransferase 1
VPFAKSRRAQSSEDDETWVHGDVSPTINCFDQGDTRATTVAVVPAMAVRRLTPRECERLQGFPDDYTLIKYRNKPAADGPRYKAIGNSMAVPVMRWIGQRIAMVDRVP